MEFLHFPCWRMEFLYFPCWRMEFLHFPCPMLLPLFFFFFFFLRYKLEGKSLFFVNIGVLVVHSS
jgi:hypothetical protein